jgi:uncharacterized NAD-dependent epimerase/dehydratase family protein
VVPVPVEAPVLDDVELVADEVAVVLVAPPSGMVPDSFEPQAASALQSKPNISAHLVVTVVMEPLEVPEPI